MDDDAAPLDNAPDWVADHTRRDPPMTSGVRHRAEIERRGAVIEGASAP